VAATSALLITALVAAVIYLVTKKPTTVDQVVILTIPSGAEITLNGKSYGTSPVKIEQLKAGSYTLTISKEFFETVNEALEISDSQPTIERKLKLATPAEVANLSLEERIKKYQEQAEAAFARESYLYPSEDSAYRYAELILGDDPANAFALEMKAKVRRQLLQRAQAEYTRGDFSSAMNILNGLIDYYGRDPEIRQALARLEVQLSSKRGEVQGLIAKAESALRAGNLLDPMHASADFFARQVLAIDGQNAQARAIRQQVKERLIESAEQAQVRGDIDIAYKQLERIAQAFPDDKQIRQLRTQLQELSAHKAAEAAKAFDPEVRRREGLDKKSRGDLAGAIKDLEFAFNNGKRTAEVIFALGESHKNLGHLAQAAEYFRQVPDVGEQRTSAIASLGDIAYDQGDADTALRRYKEARQRGGSTLYTPAKLDDKIERIERQARAKAEEPTPVAILVKHEHGVLRGSCSGTLTVNAAGVNYNTTGEHAFSANLTGVTVVVAKGGLEIRYPGKTWPFKTGLGNATQFRDALLKYQNR
jgi:tetratricopeptide (TPR) repeat protein